jgi:hypothetical protein
MKEPADLRQLLLAYRLGELSPEERERLDERMIGDQEFSDQIAEAEYDLIDDYRANRLAPAQNRRVEKAFASAELVRRPASISRGSKAPAKVQAAPSVNLFPWRLVGAALLACSLVGALLVVIHLQKTRTVAPVAVSHPAQNPEPKLPDGTSVPPTASVPAQSEPGADQVAVLVLLPAIGRGTQAPVLELQPSTEAVRVQWIVPDGSTAEAYTLSITREGTTLQTIAQHGPLRKLGDSLVAEFDFAPAEFVMPTADVQLLFSIRTVDAPHSEVGEYPVMVRHSS